MTDQDVNHQADYADTHYTRTLQAELPLTPLAGDEQADVCIVGGGIAGISAAWELTERGLSVVVLEARRVAWGASGRNGGILGTGFATSSDRIAAQTDAKSAAALSEISREGVGIVLENTRKLNLVGVNPIRGVIAASRHSDAAGTAAWKQDAAAAGSDELIYLPPDRLRSLVLSDRFHDGLLNNAAYHIHPLNYCVGLAAQTVRHGGRVYERSAMVSTDLDGPEKVVRTAQGSVRAKYVILCGSGYGGPEFGVLRRKILPIATYVVSTRGFGDRADQIMKTQAAVSDTRLSCDYFRITAEGELLWGGGMSALDRTPQDLASRMKRRITEVFPQLEDVDIALSWTGIMGYARHKMPYLQELKPNVWTATAFGGHGLNTAPAVARILAQTIAEDGQRHRLFKDFPLRWNGGPFGPLAADGIVAASNFGHRMRER